MLLCHLLLELLQQLEIKNPHRIRGLNKPNGETKNHLISLVFCQWSCNKTGKSLKQNTVEVQNKLKSEVKKEK